MSDNASQLQIALARGLLAGAIAGVGRATVRAFAARGAHIGLLARGQDGLEATQREVEAVGGKALALPTDVADPEQVEAAAEAVERELGPISIWVNNAMTSVFSPFKEMTADEFKRVTEVTYLGTVYGTMAALGRMLPRDQRQLRGPRRRPRSRCVQDAYGRRWPPDFQHPQRDHVPRSRL